MACGLAQLGQALGMRFLWWWNGGTIIVNSGNAFRMRISIAPFLLIPAAIFLGALWPGCSFEIPGRRKSEAEELEA